MPASAGTFPTDRPLFVGLLIGVILIVGGLTYFPALALGPLVEHFAMNAGTLLLDRTTSKPRRGTPMAIMELSQSRKRMPATTMTDPAILVPAIGEAFRKLDPRLMVRNPVMFVVEVVATLTTILFLRDLVTGAGDYGFSFQINLWLWFTVLFANFAEAVAEGRGKAQAATLRKAKTETMAKLLAGQGRGVAAGAGHRR